jgi:MFS family permease
LRSKANGVINLMGGVGGVIAALGLARLFDLTPLLPFISGSGLLAIAIILLFVMVKEPRVEDLAEATTHEQSEEEEAIQGVKGVRAVPRAYRKSLAFLMLAIFCWFVGYNGVSTFFTSYAVDALGVSEGLAPNLFAVAIIAFIIFALPAGFIGERIGRRRTISIGLGIFAVVLVVGFFIKDWVIITVILALGGTGWALVNINSLPMVVDTTEDARLLGTYTGLYYFASQTASTIAPAINGFIIDATGRNYRMIFLIGPAFFLLAILCMSFVTRGEAHKTETSPIACRPAAYGWLTAASTSSRLKRRWLRLISSPSSSNRI